MFPNCCDIRAKITGGGGTCFQGLTDPDFCIFVDFSFSPYIKSGKISHFLLNFAEKFLIQNIFQIFLQKISRLFQDICENLE